MELASIAAKYRIDRRRSIEFMIVFELSNYYAFLVRRQTVCVRAMQ